jgi:hypothetical protein
MTLVGEERSFRTPSKVAIDYQAALVRAGKPARDADLERAHVRAPLPPVKETSELMSRHGLS